MGRRLLFIILAVSLVLSTLAVFFFAARWVGNARGKMIGMCFYWLWCATASVLVHGKAGLDLFRGRRPLFVLGNWWVVALWASTIVSPLFIYDTIGNLSVKPVGLTLVAVPLAAINGFCEEVFWRGLFVRDSPAAWSGPWSFRRCSSLCSILGRRSATPGQLGFVLSTLCYSNGVRVLNTDYSGSARTIVMKNGTTCFTQEDYSIIRGPTGTVVATCVTDYVANTATITCVGGSPVVVSLDCMPITNFGGAVGAGCTDGTCS